MTATRRSDTGGETWRGVRRDHPGGHTAYREPSLVALEPRAFSLALLNFVMAIEDRLHELVSWQVFSELPEFCLKFAGKADFFESSPADLMAPGSDWATSWTAGFLAASGAAWPMCMRWVAIERSSRKPSSSGRTAASNPLIARSRFRSSPDELLG